MDINERAATWRPFFADSERMRMLVAISPEGKKIRAPRCGWKRASSTDMPCCWMFWLTNEKNSCVR